MRVVAAILLSVSSAFAYQVTSPGGSQGWTTSGPNYLTWNRVSTDPLNFTAVLTNTNTTVMPINNQVLNALVDGTVGTIQCNPPSGGWPTGDGFRVNLAQDAEHLDSLLAQSDQFSITGSTTTGTSTSTTSASISALTSSATTTSAGTASSDTSTTPTSSSAALPGVDTQSGLLAALAALTAFITTAF
ncbi:GPI-anchored small secreted protein [Pisolithus orientalis]|nr:GPI-anchored small secreted protein [Pisolithus orientalis]KAI6035094.1 GPI-anchored small secreted protein [Pisolithus orientalis]